MSFFSRIRAIRKTTEVKNKSWTRLPYNRQSLAGVLVTAETAQTVPAVWACLRWVSQNVALPPWSVYTESTDGDMNFPPRHPIDYLIGTRPSPYWSSFQFRETLTHWALRYGNGYAEIEFDPAVNLPIGLHPLHPERCEPRFDDSDKLFVRVYQNRGFAGEYVDLPYENVFHIRGFGDGPVGVNVMAYAAESIGWSRAAQLFGASFLGNGLHFGGFITTPDGLDQDGAERLHETLNSKARGPWRANSWTLLDAGMEPKPIEVEANKAQFIETNQYLLGDIARWFGVPPHAIGDLSRCMPADTLVFTEYGPKAISDISAGEKVWSMNDNHDLMLSAVLNNWENGISEILEISTTNRRFRCNAAHKIMVWRAIERELLHGELGGRNVNGKKVRLEWDIETIPAGWLRPGDMLISLDAIPDDSSVRTAPNGRYLTEDFMGLCGLILADGNVSKVHGAPVGLQIARSDNALYMDHYREVMRFEFNGMRLLRQAIGSIKLEDTDVVLTECIRQTRLKSVLVGRELEELGFGGTAFTKRVPDWVFTLPETMRLALIGGFLDGDGTVNKLGRVAFDSVNLNLLEDIRHLCMSCNIPVTNVQKATTTVRLPITKKMHTATIYRFTCSDARSNRKIPTFDPRYVERIASNSGFGKKARKYPRNGGGFYSSPYTSLSKIVKVERQNAEPVFDLEVEGTHCFFANGVLVHNSTNNNIEHQGIEAVQYCLMPWGRRFCDEANAKLFGANRPGYQTFMDFSEFLKGDMAALASFLGTGVDKGLLNRDEARHYIGFNSIPDGSGKKYTAQAQMTTLEQIGTVAAPEPSPVSPSSPSSAAEALAIAKLVRKARQYENV